jgi:hypothetical protein
MPARLNARSPMIYRRRVADAPGCPTCRATLVQSGAAQTPGPLRRWESPMSYWARSPFSRPAYCQGRLTPSDSANTAVRPVEHFGPTGTHRIPIPVKPSKKDTEG